MRMRQVHGRAVAGATSARARIAAPGALALAVLLGAGLGLGPEASAQQADPDYKAMTGNVLLQLGVKPKEEAPKELSVSEFREKLKTLVEEAQRAGKGDDYVNDLVIEATDDGSLAVPAGLKTAEGEVDTASLIASIVGRANGSSSDYVDSIRGEVAAEAAAEPAAGAEPAVEAEAAAEAEQAAEPIIYVVQPGDSLAAISLKFYGEPLRYDRIMEANRDQITRADVIQIGQRLVIPQ